MGSTDELHAFAYTVAELSNDYIRRFPAHENIADLLQTVSEQAGGVELFDNDGTFRVKGSWLSVSHAQSFFVEFLKSYDESKILIEPLDLFEQTEQDEQVLPIVSENIVTVQNVEPLEENIVRNVEDEVIQYLNRKAAASCALPITRKRSFVNGKPNTFSAASSIPEPIVLLTPFEQQRHVSGTPFIQSMSRKKSIEVLRDLYDIDKNLKCLQKPVVTGKKDSLKNTKIDLEPEDLPIKSGDTQEDTFKHPTPQEVAIVKTGLEDGDDSSCNLTAAKDNFSSGEHEETTCTQNPVQSETDGVVTDTNDNKDSDDDIIITFGDNCMDPDYNSDGSDFSLKNTKHSKTYSLKTSKMVTRSSVVKNDPELIKLPCKKGRGRPRKMSPKKLGYSSKRTNNIAQSVDHSVVKIKSEECFEMDKVTKGHPKGGDPKVTKEHHCKSCPYVTARKAHLKEHERRCHLTKKFQCEVCNKIFGFGKDLNRHSLTHLKPENCCDICGKMYKGVKTLTQHKLTHDSEYVKPEFNCEVCNKSFSTKYVLAYHIKSEHLGMKRRFICPTCGKSFSQKNSYIQHANVHMGYKPFSCEICGKSFSYDKSLKEHKFMHDEMKRFNCPICDKAFRQSSAITIHLKVHKTTKDYVCSACGKSFSQKQALVRHERIHVGDKPFSCQLCERTFTDSSVLRRHMILIHKKDPKKWREDTKQNTVRRADFFISVIGDNNKSGYEKDLGKSTDVNSDNGNQLDNAETEHMTEDCEDIKKGINVSSATTAIQENLVTVDLLCAGPNHEVHSVASQQTQQQTHLLNLPVEMSLVNSGQQQFHSTPLAQIIPKAEMHIQNTIMLSGNQIMDSSHLEPVDSKAHLHLLDQRGDGFTSQTHPSILPYNMVETTNYSFPAIVMIPEASPVFASTCSKGNYPQTHYVNPSNTSTGNSSNPYPSYQPQDG